MSQLFIPILLLEAAVCFLDVVVHFDGLNPARVPF